MAIFAAIFAAITALHAALLRLPYFWDEAGYYLPAARDLFLQHSLIPSATLSNAHPPLPSAALAAAWSVFGFSPVVSRLVALAFAAFGLCQFFLLAGRLAPRSAAWAAMALLAVYPPFFAQSSLIHADIFATALALFAMRIYFEERLPACGAAFALACLAKETTLVVPLSLAAFELVAYRKELGAGVRRSVAICAPSVAVLALWFAYHFAVTGHVFGNPEFFRYNVSATHSPVRIFYAALQRLWMAVGHMYLFLLTGAAAAAMLLAPLQDAGTPRPRIALRAQAAMGFVIFGSLAFHSVVGGAMLARYTLLPVALIILLCVSTLRRRVAQWLLICVACGAAFIAGWFISPPYGFAPEDNLRYADYLRIHQDGAAYLAQHYAHVAVLTAWPAGDELSHPYLSFVRVPLEVVRLENFTPERLQSAQTSNTYDVAYVFSTKQEPKYRMRLKFWEEAKARYFDHHQDASPQTAAEMLGGKIVWQEERSGEWAAVIDVPRVRLANLR